MRFLNYLKEEYVTMIRDFTIFKNPSRKEISEVVMDKKHTTYFRKMVRFVIDTRNKNYYVWHPDLMHWRVAEELNFSYPNYTGNYIYGQAYVTTGKLEPFTFSGFPLEEYYDDTMKKLKWAFRYFSEQVFISVAKDYYKT